MGQSCLPQSLLMQCDKGERLSERMAGAEKQWMKVLERFQGTFNNPTPKTLDKYKSIQG